MHVAVIIRRICLAGGTQWSLECIAVTLNHGIALECTKTASVQARPIKASWSTRTAMVNAEIHCSTVVLPPLWRHCRVAIGTPTWCGIAKPYTRNVAG